jgi:HEAT repeat protein
VEASIGGLAKQIRTGTIEVKAAALRVLGNAGSTALEQLPLIVEQAGDPDSVIRAAAIAALGSLGPAAVRPNVAILAKALLDDSDLVRDEALQALPAAGDAMRNFPYKVRDVYPTASPAVRATLVKALPIAARVLGMDDDAIARGRTALTDSSADIRIGMAYVMGQLGSPLGNPLLPELLVLLKDPEASVRGAAAIPLRAFASDDASKQKFREALQPLLKIATPRFAGRRSIRSTNSTLARVGRLWTKSPRSSRMRKNPSVPPLCARSVRQAPWPSLTWWMSSASSSMTQPYLPTPPRKLWRRSVRSPHRS